MFHAQESAAEADEFAAGVKSSAHILHLLAQEAHSVLM